MPKIWTSHMRNLNQQTIYIYISVNMSVCSCMLFMCCYMSTKNIKNIQYVKKLNNNEEKDYCSVLLIYLFIII